MEQDFDPTMDERTATELADETYSCMVSEHGYIPESETGKLKLAIFDAILADVKEKFGPLGSPATAASSWGDRLTDDLPTLVMGDENGKIPEKIQVNWPHLNKLMDDYVEGVWGGPC